MSLTESIVEDAALKLQMEHRTPNIEHRSEETNLKSGFEIRRSMNPPITITEVIGRSEQGFTRPFFCSADSGMGYRLMYCVKGAYAGKNSLCCEWVASRLAHLLVDGDALALAPFRMAEVPPELIDASARADIQDLGEGRVFASLMSAGGQELTWSEAQDWPDEAKATLLLVDLWLQNEDRTLSEHGGNPNLLVERIYRVTDEIPGGTRTRVEHGGKRLWAFDFNLAFDEDFDRERFFGTHVFGGMLKEWPEGFRERMETRMRRAMGRFREIFSELPAEWLHVDGDESLPVQLGEERVSSLLELPFTDPDGFWKLP